LTSSTATSDTTAAAARTGAWSRAPRQLWAGPVHDPSGHADELRGFLRALERAGHEPVLRVVASSATKAGLPRAELDMLETQRERPLGDARRRPMVAVYEYLPHPLQHVIDGAVNVARVMFETDTLPASWRLPLLDRDEVWVPSQFNVETFARGGVPEERLKILGGTLDFDLFTSGVEPLDLGAPAGCFTFLTNFDFSERKGWRQLIRAWAKAFAPTDPVCLVLKVGSLLSDGDMVRRRIESFIQAESASGGGLAPIRVMSESLTTAQMPALYAGADAYVAPSRGEGWGRPYMEALAMGLPTIGSNWSGNLAFMDPATSWLIDGELVEIARDEELFVDLYAGHRWFEPDGDELAAAMQDVAGDPDAARAKAAPARDDLIRRFGPEATAARIAELALAAFDRHGERRVRPLYAVVRGSDGALATSVVGQRQNVRLRASGTPQLRSDVPGIAHDWSPESELITDGPAVGVLASGAAVPDPAWLHQARLRLDRVWVDSDDLRARLLDAGLPPGIVETVDSPERAETSLATLNSEGLPPARHLGRARIEARSNFAVYAPDWNDDATWSTAIDAWLAAFGPEDDVTLALYVDGDADAIGGRVLAHLAGHEESALPDLALVVPSSVSLVALAAAADAVLTDGPVDPAADPRLLRRARRIVRAGVEAEKRALADELKGGV
jgi:glycosyltransferase involved in cell wall biosynthesis